MIFSQINELERTPFSQNSCESPSAIVTAIISSELQLFHCDIVIKHRSNNMDLLITQT
jgi:hypothetical protein